MRNPNPVYCSSCKTRITGRNNGYYNRIGLARFCSQTCRKTGRLKALANFISQFSSVPNDRGCILWMKCRNPAGYGYFADVAENKKILAHRAAYEVRNGPFDPSLNVLHRCDTPACINPDHLFLGTHADNTADKFAKGRGLIGDSCPHRILGSDQVREIREQYKRGGISQYKLARHFGVSRSLVNNILRGDRWKSVA